MGNYLTGEVILWASTRIPTGFLACDGRSLSTTDYPDLFAMIGFTYGGSGAQFSLPQLTGATPSNAAGPLTYLICAEGLSGPNASFVAAYGMVADLRLLAGPKVTLSGAATTEGQILPISANQALYALIGTSFGGDGRTTFALPNIAPLTSGNGGTVWTYILTDGPVPSSNYIYGESFLAEIRLSVVESEVPGGWVVCQGGSLLIHDHAALYSLLGGQFGQPNDLTFGVPNLPLVDLGFQQFSYIIAKDGFYPSLS